MHEGGLTWMALLWKRIMLISGHEVLLSFLGGRRV